ncbi:MAG: calcium/sodium antiporter [Candidatus Pacebacteria bacterium]|jgi:cation:H+ antiporter|nr:calcium/sodium antiporter [Candidatus Paceibacterota bacterium]|tara:strand:+ start:281 stop:1267 length:987 start_codon:yes stop_codon:yes gene_type:complete
MLIFWIIVFIISITVLVKGADWLLGSAEKIGLAVGLSPFIVGVVIVGLGTSFPELISSLVATFRGVTEIVTANAIGSNIANILLIVGISAVVGGRLTVTKNLIDVDLPLLAVSTALFLGIVWDRQIVLGESILLLVLFVIYLLYTILHKDDEEEVEVLSTRSDRRKHITGPKKEAIQRPKVTGKDILFLIIGVLGLAIGAKYLIDSVIKLSEILAIGAGVISLVAVSLGTSLPELLVSIKAAWQKKPEVALGNIFGSNVFNILLVIGIPGLFKTLILDEQTFTLGIPVLIVATFLFIISGISRKIHVYEGAMYIVIYIFFIGKLFGFL